jgi:hypothetical protein
MAAYEDTDELLNRLSAIPERIFRAVEGWDGVQLAAAEDEWSAREILAHIRASSDIVVYRLYAIVVRDEPSLPAFDERRWAEVARYAQADFHTALSEYALRRASLVDMLRYIAPADWDRTGVHEVLGPRSLRQLAFSLVEHEEEHCAQLEALRKD